MARLIELLSTRKNSRKKSTVCYFKNFIEKFEFGSRVFRRSVSLRFPVLLFPLFYYSLFHESLHKKMRLIQNVDSTLQNIDGNFRVTRIEAFPSQVFGHCPRICSPPYRINPTTSRSPEIENFICPLLRHSSFALNTGILLTKSRPTFKYPKFPR